MNEHTKKIIIRSLIGAGIAVAVVAIVILANILAKQYAGIRQEAPIAENPDMLQADFVPDSGVSYTYAVTDSRVFCVSAENTKIIDADGKIESDVTLPVANPLVSANGNFVLISDREGKSSYLFEGSRQKLQVNPQDQIVSASVNANGYSVFVTKSNVHKNAVVVYDKSGTEIFKWNSGVLYVLDAKLLDNNRDVAVAAVSTEGGVIESHLVLFNVNRETPNVNDSYPDALYGAISVCGNNVYFIGDNAAQAYNSAGKKIGSVDYEGKELATFSADGDLLVLAFSGSTAGAAGSTLEAYNTAGKLQGSLELAQEVEYLDCCNGRIAVNNNRVISILNSKCSEQFGINPGIDIRELFFFGGNGRAVGITATGAQFIEVRA